MSANPKAKVEEMDREIDRLTGIVTSEKAATKEVVDDLRRKLHSNQLLNTAIRSAIGTVNEEPIPLPFGLG